uniref:Mal, T cell differentiation protein 2 (gene/pseudogene) n=1 Tax=Anser cygnoides TaxID=8845 RepID=A0A8B9DJ19_ANSCY
MFVAVTAWFLSIVFLCVFLFGYANRIAVNWNQTDFLFHGATFVFYFGAFLLQAATTSLHHFPRRFNSTTHEKILADHEYNISIAASVCISLTCIWGQKSAVSPCSQLLKTGEVIVFESSKYFHSGMQKISQ